MRQLTDLKVQSLKRKNKPFDVKDTQVPGLHVRVMPTGKKTFVLLARFPNSSNPTRRAIGAYGDISLAEAREKATAWRKLIKQNVDPSVQEERDRQATLRQQRVTFDVVAADFIRDKLPNEKRGWECELDIRREFLKPWGKLPITEITEQQVASFIKGVKARGNPAMARNLLALARRMFTWAIDQRCYGLEASPCQRLKPVALVGKKNDRNRVLTDAELKALWGAAESLGYPYGSMYRMLVLTGQRRTEVAEARWSEIDLAKRLWTIPAERMKADAAHEVPLSDDVMQLLESLPRGNRGDFVFSHSFGQYPVSRFSDAKIKLDAAIAKEIGPVDFVVHDIRRTMRTHLSAIPNISDLVRELVIGHTKPGLHKVYDQHAYESEKRFALDAWAARLRSIVEPAPDNVIQLDRALPSTA